MCPKNPKCPFFRVVVVSKIAVDHGTEWIPWTVMAPDLSLNLIPFLIFRDLGHSLAVKLCANSLKSLNASLLTLEKLRELKDVFEVIKEKKFIYIL